MKMSNEMWDWGAAGEPSNLSQPVPTVDNTVPVKKHLTNEQFAEKQAKQLERAKAFDESQQRRIVRQAKYDAEFQRLTLEFVDANVNGTDYEYVWFGSIAGDLNKGIKALLAHKLPKERIFPVKGFRYFHRSGATLHNNRLIMNTEFYDYVYLRLDKDEAMKMKLSYSGEYKMVHDPKGLKWASLAGSLLVERFKQNSTPTLDDIAEKIRRHILTELKELKAY